MADPEDACVPVDVAPAQGQRFLAAQPVNMANQGAPRITSLSTSASIPARQRGGTETWRRGFEWNRPPSASRRLTGLRRNKGPIDGTGLDEVTPIQLPVVLQSHQNRAPYIGLADIQTFLSVYCPLTFGMLDYKRGSPPQAVSQAGLLCA